MPNLIPDWLPWMRPAGRLMISLVFTAIALGIVFAMLRRPKSDQPATWAQSMAGAVGVFGIFFLCYAIVPHEFLTFANSYLNWSTAKFLVQHNQFAKFGNFQIPPIDIPYSAVKDAVAAAIYIVFFGLNLLIWSKWQKRPLASDAESPGEETVVRTSRFGRPVKARA